MKYEKFEKLQNQGIIDDGEGLTEEQKQQIESLSEEELDALISIKRKLGAFEWPIKTIIRPQMF